MAGVFPLTNYSVLVRVRSDDREVREQALSQIARVYYAAIYKHLRLKWQKSPGQAEDLTQHFFVKALEREMFASYEPSKARFRTFIRVCIDRVTMNYDEAKRADKRGGQMRFADVDSRAAEAELAASTQTGPYDAEALFEQEWARSVLAMACERLEHELVDSGRRRQWEVFSRHDLTDDEVSYQHVAKAMGVPVTTVTNDLSRARKAFRETTLTVLKQLTASQQEFEDEARTLLGLQS